MQFVLRRHSKAVKCLQLWKGLNYPILVSGDEGGLVLCWNLLTKKPFASFKCAEQVVCLQQIHNVLLVTSKDHTLKIVKFPMDVVSFRRETSSLVSLELLYEIPVNTLNFSNTLVEQVSEDRFRLWCCNTQDSALIDIYEFSILGSKDLCRKQKGISLYETVRPLINTDVTKIDRLGIIMKFVAFEGTVYCGFESGFVVGLRLSGNTLHVVYVSSVHYPDPVLNMSVGQDIKEVISSSTSDEIGFHRERNSFCGSSSIEVENCYALDDRTVYKDFKKCPIDKISYLEQVDGFYVLSNWNGITKVFDLSLKSCFSNISKRRAQVYVDDNCIGNATIEKEVINIKISSMLCISKKTISNDEKLLNTFTEGERRRLFRFFNQTWCLIGYDDGSISANPIQSKQILQN